MNRTLGRSAAMVVLGAVFLLFSGCAPKTVSKNKAYPLMYEEAPVAILILPPINESTAADAKEYYATTITEPFSYYGYYVLPYEVTSELLKMEGIYDTELLKNTPLVKFREYFGADAVMFTTIKRWDLSYLVLAASLTVTIDFELKSTKTDRVLWKRRGHVVVDLSGGNTGGGVAGLIAKAIVTAVNSAAADYVPHARNANRRALGPLPYGKYHGSFNKDQEQQFIEGRQIQ
jgi:hypothetical protein